MADSSNKGAVDAPKNQAETMKRADKSGIYTKPEGRTGAGGTGASGATGAGGTASTGTKLGTGNKPTEASTGTSASPQPK